MYHIEEFEFCFSIIKISKEKTKIFYPNFGLIDSNI